MIGWKVVTVVDGRMHSSSSCMMYDVEYFLNEFVSREEGFGPLCLFKTLKAAKQYCKNFYIPRYKIFKAEYIPSKDKALWYGNPPFLNPPEGDRIEVKDLKKEYPDALHLIKTDDLITAEQIKLLKEYSNPPKE